jgi:hypothetical protein
MFRVKDMYGHTIIDSAIVHTPNASVPGKSQFPFCQPQKRMRVAARVSQAGRNLHMSPVFISL